MNPIVKKSFYILRIISNTIYMYNIKQSIIQYYYLMVEIQKLLAPDFNLLHSNSRAVRMSRHSSTSPTFSLSSFGHVCSIGTTAFLALFTTPPPKKKKNFDVFLFDPFVFYPSFRSFLFSKNFIPTKDRLNCVGVSYLI